MDVVDTIDKTSSDEITPVEVSVSDAGAEKVTKEGEESVEDEEINAAAEGSEAETAYTQVEGTMIYAESGTTEEQIAASVSGWSLLPESVRSKLAEYGMKVYLSETACSTIGEQYGGYTYGLKYKANAATLEITTITQNAYCIIGTKGDIEGTVLHEVAHLLDFGIAIMEEGVYSASNCRISDSEEWQKICEKDGAKIATIDSQTAANSYSSKELFAEAFRLAFQDPEELKSVSQEAYDFVQRMVKKYTSSAG